VNIPATTTIIIMIPAVLPNAPVTAPVMLDNAPSLASGAFVLSLALTIKLNFLQSLRIVFGSFYVLFLPGHFLTYAFFPKKDIDFIERLTLSFALSIAIVPLLVFYLNLIGMK